MSSGAVLKALLLADLVGSTDWVRRLGDAGAAELFHRHDRLARDLLAASGGREIDKSDGFLLLFDRPYDAVVFALAYHDALRGLGAEHGAPLQARAGVHLGEVVLHENHPDDVARGAKPLEVEGLAKPMVARLTSLAGPGQTLLTRAAFDLARRAAVGERVANREVRWLAHGEYRFQGVDEPVAIFEVGAVGRAPLAPPAEAEKARRMVSMTGEITLGWRPAPGIGIPQRPHWKLERRLGTGGFGEVWLARHAKTNDERIFKFCYEPEQLRTLRREVAVFRLLKEVLGNRNDIARIFDWNFDESPYFVESEYTEGGDLVQWATEQGGIREVPMATRLELIAQVAEALAAAHSVGVLHKDVKPANVLITRGREGRPRARLTDFGIGLITDSRLLAARGITSFGLTELTPEATDTATGGTRMYMAPELLEGKPATVQADIYALGMMLYQMVVGDLSRALAPGWRRDVADELLREDLAAFVDGEPSRRPASALEVAERLRTLDERRARREAERREREEAELSHRRRRLWGTVAAVASVFLVVVSILAVQAIRARQEAEHRREQAEELVSFMVGDLRAKLDPVARREVLGDIADQVLAYFDSLPRERLSDSELARRAKALTQIGEVRIAQGDLPAALDAFREALSLSGDLAGRNATHSEWLSGLGNAHFWVGYTLREQGDLQAASPHMEDYLEVAERLVALEPDNPAWRLEEAWGHNSLGFLLRDQGKLPEALTELEASLRIKQQLHAENPGDPDLEFGLAASFNAVASVLEEMGQLGQALEQYRADLAIKQALVQGNPNHARWRQSLALSHNSVGRMLETQGDNEGALVELRAAVGLLALLVEHDPDNAAWQRDLAVNRLRLGSVLLAAGQAGDALEAVEAAHRELQELVDQDATNRLWQLDLLQAGYRLAEVRSAQGQVGQAQAKLREARESLDTLSFQGQEERLARRLKSSILLLEGRLLAEQGQGDEARAAWTSAAETIAPLARSSDDFQILIPWATALLELERTAEARPIVRKLLAMGYAEPGFRALCAGKKML